MPGICRDPLDELFGTRQSVVLSECRLRFHDRRLFNEKRRRFLPCRRRSAVPERLRSGIRPSQHRRRNNRPALVEIPAGATVEVQLDAPNDFLRGDHLHATRQRPNDIHAQVLVIPVAITQRHRARTPTAAVLTTRQCTDSVDELVPGILLPMRWLPSAGHDHAGSQLPPTPNLELRTWRFLERHSRGQMHQAGHRADHALRMVNEQDEFAQRGLAPQIEHPPRWRMMIPPPFQPARTGFALGNGPPLSASASFATI